MKKRLWLGISAGAVIVAAAVGGVFFATKGDGTATAKGGEKAPTGAPEKAAGVPDPTTPPADLMPLAVDDFAKLGSDGAPPAQFETPTTAYPGPEEPATGDAPVPPAPFRTTGGPPAGGEFAPISLETSSGQGEFLLPPTGEQPTASWANEPPADPAADDASATPETVTISDVGPGPEAAAPPEDPIPFGPLLEAPETPSMPAGGLLTDAPEVTSPEVSPTAEADPSVASEPVPGNELPLVTAPSPYNSPEPSLGAAPSSIMPPVEAESPSAPTLPIAPEPAAPLLDPAPVTVPVATALAAPVPGPRRLDGLQSPALSLEKFAPQEIQVGKAATFETIVRNTGQVTAQHVVVTDHVPQGTQLVNATPQYQHSPGGAIVWQLGSLDPDEEVVITMELMPQAEGEIGSVAQVSFQTQASVRALCTKPELAVEHTARDSVLIGDEIVFDIRISNPGTGAATGVVLEEDVPPGLTHPMGRRLERPVGTLQPDETRQLELVLKAAEAGALANVIRVRGDGGLFAEHRVQLEVVAPQVQVAVSGPSRRFLERQGAYEITVTNPGTAAATHVELVAELPPGLQFVSADQEGQYDRRDHLVYWTLVELPPQQPSVFRLTALPIETGPQELSVKSEADLGLSHEFQHTTNVEGITEVRFSVSDVQDPIEVGTETTYEIRVTNNGSKTAANVNVAAMLTNGMTPIEGDGPTSVQISGQQIVMDPVDELKPGAEAVYRIRVQGAQPGDHIMRVQLASDDAPNPVTKEEGTLVYSDD